MKKRLRICIGCTILAIIAAVVLIPQMVQADDAYSLYLHHIGITAPENGTVAGSIFSNMYVPPEPPANQWGATSYVWSDSISPFFGSVAVSGIMENHGGQGHWAGHFQCQTHKPGGTCRGIEVNILSGGPEDGKPWQPRNVVLDVIGAGLPGAHDPEVHTLLWLRSQDPFYVEGDGGPSSQPANIRYGLKINDNTGVGQRGKIDTAIFINTGGDAIVIQKGQKICLDGATCKRYIWVNPTTGKTEIQ